VRDVFDYFYPGYVDMWPSMTGATGMTFETDGGPEIRLRKEDGTVTTFTDGIAHHFTGLARDARRAGDRTGGAAPGLSRLP
jgi:hypothetical protein